MRHTNISCLHILSILWCLPPTTAMIYLESIQEAHLYDMKAANGTDELPFHFLTESSLPSSLFAATMMPSTSGATVMPSAAPSSMPSASPPSSDVFDRQLSWSIEEGEEIREANNELFPFSFGHSEEDEGASDEVDDNDRDVPGHNSSTTSSSSIPKFSDLNLINSSSDYVYYDSKQARFGMDIGPPGSFDMVHLMLPPRGLWGGLLLEHDFMEADDVEVAEFLEDERSNSTADDEYASESTNFTLRGSDRRIRQRKIETIDEFLGLAEPSDESEYLASNSSLVDQLNQTVSANETDALQNATSFDKSNTTLNETSSPFNSNISNSSSISVYVSDYFCLEDFVEWSTRQQSRDQNLQSATIPVLRDGINESAVLNTTSESKQLLNASINPNITNKNTLLSTTYTRPLAILALRGRCSFSSKAQMAMLLNELFASNNFTTRISHVIIYNNGTAHEDDEEDGEEKLIDMGLPSQTSSGEEGFGQEEDRYESRYTVGLLYITTLSGRDLMRRMKERGDGLGIEPYLEVGGLFDGLHDDGRLRDNTTIMNFPTGVYNDTVRQNETLHDKWSFPVTLTRFCLSCGPERNYGYDLLPTKDEPDSSWDDPFGYNNGHWDHPDGWMPPEHNDPYADRDPYGHYGTISYFPGEWVEAVRKLMISVLAILIIGPFVLAAWRWRSVGGTIRLARDENGTRRLRLIAPNLEVFVNGVPGTVEENGTKLDRYQVFALPEMEWNGESGDGSGILCEIPRQDSMTSQDNDNASNVSADDQPLAALAQSPQCLESGLLETGIFVSSTECAICIEAFEHGERLRVLPRCSHPFHTECILPWLTERQGCCPLCKTPVLPDEYQRNRRVRQHASPNSRSRNRLMRSFRERVHLPQSTTVETTNDSSDDDGQLAQELQLDLEGSPRAISLSEDTLEITQQLEDSQQLQENDERIIVIEEDEEQNHPSNTNDNQNNFATANDGACEERFDPSRESQTQKDAPLSQEQIQEKQHKECNEPISSPHTTNEITTATDHLAESIPEQAQQLQQSQLNEIDKPLAANEEKNHPQNNAGMVCGKNSSSSNGADILPESVAEAQIDP